VENVDRNNLAVERGRKALAEAMAKVEHLLAAGEWSETANFSPRRRECPVCGWSAEAGHLRHMPEHGPRDTCAMCQKGTHRCTYGEALAAAREALAAERADS
jgi:hypothetical protein